MIHKILVDLHHNEKFKKHEREALQKLRLGIHEIVGGVTSLKVTIYLEDIDPIVIIYGKGENELVTQFKENGDVDFKWTEKTLGQKTKEFFGDFASKVIYKIVDILAQVVGENISTGIQWIGKKAIAWKSGDT